LEMYVNIYLLTFFCDFFCKCTFRHYSS
jgi:hypothetical protein